MACKYCEQRSKNGRGSNSKCAFVKDGFDTGNFKCASMYALLGIAKEIHKKGIFKNITKLPGGRNGSIIPIKGVNDDYCLTLSWRDNESYMDIAIDIGGECYYPSQQFIEEIIEDWVNQYPDWGISQEIKSWENKK